MSRGISDKITYKTYNRGGTAAHSLPEAGLHDNQHILKREAERPDRRNIHIDSEAPEQEKYCRYAPNIQAMRKR